MMMSPPPGTRLPRGVWSLVSCVSPESWSRYMTSEITGEINSKVVCIAEKRELTPGVLLMDGLEILR